MESITLEKERLSWAQPLPQASLSLAGTEEKGLRPGGRQDWVLDCARCSSSPSCIFTACSRFPWRGLVLPNALAHSLGTVLCSREAPGPSPH